MVRFKGEYGPGDAGCYLDSARGQYMVDGVVAFAEDHGFINPRDDVSTLTQYEDANEIWDDAEVYMNEHYAVEGFHWGSNENGDWGLWPNEEEVA